MEYKAKNLFYISNFNTIGGVETYIFELTRKYKDKDILVIYRTGSEEQIRRIKYNVPIIRHKEENTYICDKAFFNYETDIIDQIEAKEYIQLIHAMWKTQGLTPRINPKINTYFAVSKSAGDEWEELTGIKPIINRNPLQILDEEREPAIWLLSATRLTPEKRKR